MNDITAILDKIDSDAQKARDEILLNAKLAAETIRSEGIRQSEEEAQAILEDADRQVKAIRQRAESQVGIEARNIRLAARRQTMDQVFTRTMELLCGMPEEKKAKLYAELIIQNLEEEAELILNEEETKSIGPRVLGLLARNEARASEEEGGKPESITAAITQKVRAFITATNIYKDVALSKTPGSFKGGFILRQGKIETNCTFEVLVAGVKDQMEAQVALILFS